MIIETALVAPLLILLGFGSFEISQIVSRQHELQIAVAEAEAISLAANAGASTDTTALAAILRNTLSLGSEQVVVVKAFRCNADVALVGSASQCNEDDVVSSYVKITLHDRYSPFWTKFGISGPFDFNVVRMIQLS